MKNIPFVSNTSDNLHCVPACFMMIAKYFDAKFSVSMDEWARQCGFEPGKGTWANGGLLWFIEHGYDVVHMEDFDDKRFIRERGDYLISLHGKETGNWMIEHTNMVAEVARIQKISIRPEVYSRAIPTLNDMKRMLDNGYLLRIAVNWNSLHDKSGYDGLSIIGYDYDEKYMYIHDPGLPPQEAIALPWHKLDAISADPSIKNRELDAIKLKSVVE